MVIQKEIDPRVHLLNDNDNGVDYVGEFTYADALAESIHQVDTPITIGIFAEWGAGKSFLLRHLESILKRLQGQSLVDTMRSGGGAHNYKSRVAKAVLWTLWSLLLLGGLVLVILAGSFFNVPFEKNNTISISSSDKYVNTTTNSLRLEESEAAQFIRELQIAGLIMILIAIAILFLLVYCGNTWFSASYYGRFRLLIYGKFTKLPTWNKQIDIVEDPGQNPAEILTRMQSGDETRTAPRRYIFVDFKAWEYAGSDTLWAGIVTKLSDAVEAEFGVITARLFRMLHVEEISQNRPDTGDRTLCAQFPCQCDEKIKDLVRRYGVVTECEKVKSDSPYWKVTYSNEGECRRAKHCLQIEGVDLQTHQPTRESRKRKIRPSRGSGKPLLNNAEMQAIATPRNDEEKGENEDEGGVETEIKAEKSRCCSRFCKHFRGHPAKTLCMPRLVWWILLPVVCVCIPILVYIITDLLEIHVVRTYRTTPVALQVLMWLPPGSAFTVSAVRFLWAMCHSQRQRIDRALEGTKTKMAEQLGFMDKVKTEVTVISKLIHCASFTYQLDFKVIVTIDDLDRVPLDKVKSVLEAVNILLSDKSSPFVCLIAVDPRIAVKCIEDGMGDALIKANITGHEYLKKIINLPVCLPEIGNRGKRRFIAGLVDQADRSNTHPVCDSRKEKVASSTNNEAAVSNGRSDDAVDGAPPTEKVASSTNNEAAVSNGHSDDAVDGAPPAKPCQHIIQEDLASTSDAEDAVRKGNTEDALGRPPPAVRSKKLAEDLVRWIILADQWPYRTSYILQVIEDAEQRQAAGIENENIPDYMTIFDIFQDKVLAEFKTADRNLLGLDADPEVFYSYIRLLKSCGFTKRRIVEMQQYTVNLDYSIRHSIAFERDLSCMDPPESDKKVGNATRPSEEAPNPQGLLRIKK